MKRGWTYLQERFPLGVQGPLILIFSLAGVTYSAMVRGDAHLSFKTVGIAFVSSLILFLQLRIADEFKDFEEDRQFRAYRPVPRGLVSLQELGVAFGIGMGIQAGLALWLDPRLLLILLGVWGYLGAMSWEFGIPTWLKAHPVLYLLSHMVIMPLLHLYITALDWLPQEGSPSVALVWLLGTSFCNGIVLEIGRKIRSPEDEETGVETYSSLWGCRRAVWIWWGMLGVTGILAGIAASQIGAWVWTSGILGMTGLLAVAMGIGFLNQLGSKQGKWLEALSGLWTLLLYLSLGLIPLIWRG